MNLLELLEEQGVMSAQDAEVIARTRADKSLSFEAAALEHSVPAEKILAALGTYYNLPTRALGPRERIDSETLKYIPEESARHYRMLPLGVNNGVLEVGVADPDDLDITNVLTFLATKNKLPYRLVLMLERDIDRGLAMYENLTHEVGQALSALEGELSASIDAKQQQDKQQQAEPQEEYIQEEAPVTKMVATILRYAVDGKASDIHIEPTATRVQVRFRVDGTLVKSIELPKKVHAAVVARIKILATLRLDEKRKPH
jgi:type IV pilus assembly protein PilB